MTISSTPDATGIVGHTFGNGRLLQFVSSARHIGGGAWWNPGLASWLLPGSDEPVAVAGCHHELVFPLTSNDDGALSLGMTTTTAETDTTKILTEAQPSTCEVIWTDDGVAVTEATPGTHRLLAASHSLASRCRHQEMSRRSSSSILGCASPTVRTSSSSMSKERSSAERDCPTGTRTSGSCAHWSASISKSRPTPCAGGSPVPLRHRQD